MNATAAAPIVPSRGEIDATVRKAARGVGMSWGMAEEAGAAARWLETRGVPCLEAVAALLRRLDGGCAAFQPPEPLDVLAQASGPFCPIHVGVRLLDSAATLTDNPIRLPSVLAPQLLVPFACAAALPGGAVRLSGEGLAVVCGRDGFTGEAQGEGASGPLTAERSVDAPPPRLPVPARAVDGAVWDALLRYAARTYAPATEASRLAGAGGGSDND